MCAQWKSENWDGPSLLSRELRDSFNWRRVRLLAETEPVLGLRRLCAAVLVSAPDSRALSLAASWLRPTPTGRQPWQTYLIHEVGGELPPFMCNTCYQAQPRAMQCEAEATQRKSEIDLPIGSGDRGLAKRIKHKQSRACRAHCCHCSQARYEGERSHRNLRGQLSAVRKQNEVLQARIKDWGRCKFLCVLLLLGCVVVRRRQR